MLQAAGCKQLVPCMLLSFSKVQVRNVRDAVPKAIGFYLVRAVTWLSRQSSKPCRACGRYFEVQDKLQFELLNALNQKDFAILAITIHQHQA